MTSEQIAGTTVRQLNAEGMVVSACSSLIVLRGVAAQTLVDANTRARVLIVDRLVLTASVDARAVESGCFGLCEHDNGAMSECTGTTLVIQVSVHEGDFIAAVDKLTAAYNIVFGQHDDVPSLARTAE